MMARLPVAAKSWTRLSMQCLSVPPNHLSDPMQWSLVLLGGQLGNPQLYNLPHIS